MNKSLTTLLGVVILAIFLLACNLGVSATPDAAATLNPLYTAAAQTLQAMVTQEASVTPMVILPSSTPFPTGTPILTFPTATLRLSTATVQTRRCDAAAFVRDVTIPDGSTLATGKSFTKTWRLQNVGSCSWTPSYALIFVSGDGMSAPNAVNLGRTVNPGETVDVAVNLVSPNKKGHYRSYWKLRNASGVLFGIGAQADTAFWVDINVQGKEYVAYDFVARACAAEWASNSGALPCPGVEDDNDGYVLKLSDPRLENGTRPDQPGLLTVPKNTQNGYIYGEYPAIQIHQGDHFVTTVGCQYGANSCNVLMRLEYKIVGGKIKVLDEWHEINEGGIYGVNLDLSFLAGEKVKFYFSADAYGTKGRDEALWLAPRIVRQGTPPPTPTRTASPTVTSSVTVTSTATFTPTATATATETATATATSTP